MTDSQVLEVTKSLEKESLRYVVFIGSEPIYPESKTILLEVQARYILVYSFVEDFIIYPHLSAQKISVMIYEKT